MSTIYAISVGLNFAAIAVILVLLIAAIMGGNLKEPTARAFFFMVLFGTFSLLFDALIALFSGTPGGIFTVLVRVFDTVVLVCGALQMVMFAQYLYEYLRARVPGISKKPFILLNVLCGVHMVMAFVATFTGLYTRLDGNNTYRMTNYFWISVAIPFLWYSICIAVTMRYVKFLKVREWIAFVLYAVVLLACYVAEVMVDDLWVAEPGAVLVLLFLYVSIQVDNAKRKEAELADSRVAIMLSQIQPHFLYNSLSAIENLCDVDIEKTKTAVNDFAHYLRGNLESIQHHRLVPFEDEMEHVETYLSLEKLRFGSKLDIVFQIQASDFMLPPLTVQPIAENAVRHGVSKTERGGTVRIDAREAPDAYIVTVTDDGAGFCPDAPQQDGARHIGIENVRKRLAAQMGGTLEIESTPGAGTKAVITLPKR